MHTGNLFYHISSNAFLIFALTRSINIFTFTLTSAIHITHDLEKKATTTTKAISNIPIYTMIPFRWQKKSEKIITDNRIGRYCRWNL